METQQQEGNRMIWILAIVGGALVLCLLVFCVVVGILTMLGPSVGNVFSGIVTTMPPTP